MQTNPPHKLHVAIIMDGNGRWAEARGLPRPIGHQAGADAVRAIVRSAIENDVGALTLYAFSTYNWRRSDAEVAGLMALLRHFLLVEARQLRDTNVRISILGRRDRLPLGLVKAIATAERTTAACSGLHLRIAIDYSAREAILAAAAAGLTPEALAAQLGTEDVDLLIRTGGDRRLSDFLLWECAYAELLFTEVKWPDFGPPQFEAALADYARRTRSFGGVADAA
ncbi:MAG: Isoprenyl transferase [Devosia sp.]|uniref:polyprenyl diphosphate synthase n=1 Tax=Devosia sp. TaxID=1871048 RepID=UPI0026098B94|nr:polyprenyl diphosphate synthase [Devosia sp.]MDB5538960.1 Isoprenyl transferase [Devosia sp.]